MLEGAGAAAGPGGFLAEGVDTSEASCCFSLRLICWLWTHSKVHCLFVLTQFVHGPRRSGWSSVPGVVLVSSERERWIQPFLSLFPPQVLRSGLGEWMNVSGSKNTSMTRNGWVSRGLRGLYNGAGRIERPLVAQPDGVASSFTLPALVAARVLSPAHCHRCAIRPCACVSSGCKVAKAGRSNGVRRTSDLARRELGRDGTPR